MPKFPGLIYVIEDENNYLAVMEDGVSGLDEPDMPIAIYKLVDVGKVAIQKQFVSTLKKPRVH